MGAYVLLLLRLISVRKLAQNPKIPATERKVLVARYEDGTVAYIDDLCVSVPSLNNFFELT